MSIPAVLPAAAGALLGGAIGYGVNKVVVTPSAPTPVYAGSQVVAGALALGAVAGGLIGGFGLSFADEGIARFVAVGGLAAAAGGVSAMVSEAGDR